MQDVSRALHESGFVWKCVENKAAELDPFKMQLYREMWMRRGYTVNQPVFVDEVGTVSSNEKNPCPLKTKLRHPLMPVSVAIPSVAFSALYALTHPPSLSSFTLPDFTQNSLVVNKRRGWVQVGERSTSKTICGRGKKYTSIAAMWKGGLVATSTFEGAADTETFLDYIVSSVVGPREWKGVYGGRVHIPLNARHSSL